MTFKNLQDEIIALRFDESRRAQVKNWITTAYAKIWDADDWFFKHVQKATLSATIGDATPTMPSDFAKAEALFDATGEQLAYLDPIVWRDSYENQTGTGLPDAYTVIDREIYLGPLPNSNSTLTLSYVRRLVKIAATTGLVAVGNLSVDGDQPIWDAEYDYVLVYEAAIIGGQLLGDTDWQSLVQGRDEIRAAMREDLVGQTQNEIPSVVGAWPGVRSWWE